MTCTKGHGNAPDGDWNGDASTAGIDVVPRELDVLHQIRAFEYARVVRAFPPGAKVLELGGGTGYQAALLARDGYEVVSVDVPGSCYEGRQVFPVLAFDGRNLPFADASFDLVYSSNVLEHVMDLSALLAETRRVLKPGGCCLHVLPTASWRLWTNLTHYGPFARELAARLRACLPAGASRAAWKGARRHWLGALRYCRQNALAPRHGEFGTSLSELRTFGQRAWLSRFREEGFLVDWSEPLGLFYSGHLLCADRLGIERRVRLAGVLGSSCRLYKIRPAT